MLNSLNIALTGLNNNSLAINVIGNNLANLNTTAFKGSKTSFSELLGGLATTTASDGNPIQIGQGVSVPAVSPVFTQGAIEYTGRATDAAISGNGFFVVETGQGSQGYSRAGNFGFSKTGVLINDEGFNVLGYSAKAGVIDQTTPPGAITILKGGSLPPRITSVFDIVANLDSEAAVDDVFSTTVTIYDSLGASHVVTLNFTNTAPGAWSWESTMSALDTGGTATDPPVSLGTGTVAFDETGVLTGVTDNPTIDIAGLANGAADMTLEFALLDDDGNPRLTGYSAPSSVSSTSQDGYATSVLRDFSIDSDGVISGIFDNGMLQPLAQLVLANFSNEQGLIKFKGSTFVPGTNSGEPSIGVPGTGGRGAIKGGSLEQSNVDLAQEFTDLIVAQRGYQANSRMISTTDELMQEAINLTR